MRYIYNLSVFLEYAQVTKMLGNGRLEATCFDGVKRLCHIRGKLRKKVIYYMPKKVSHDYEFAEHLVHEFGCVV